MLAGTNSAKNGWCFDFALSLALASWMQVLGGYFIVEMTGY